jgi:hypothetical protein
MNRLACVISLGRIGLAFLLVGCGVAAPTGTTAPPTVTPPAEIATASANPNSGPTPSSKPSLVDIMKFRPLAPIASGTYFIDADTDPSTPLRVVYEVVAEGWSMWIGATKFSDAGHVGVSITTVVNLVTDGCRDHSWADPPIGLSVNDLAAALAALAPFQVTSAPEDVTIYGYSGKHLALTVPDLPVDAEGEHGHFTGCTDGDLKSWVAPIDSAEPGDAYYGYTGPGYSEEYWILDVEGTRLMIVAERSPGSPSEDLVEQRAILDSIRIEP